MRLVVAALAALAVACSSIATVPAGCVAPSQTDVSPSPPRAGLCQGRVSTDARVYNRGQLITATVTYINQSLEACTGPGAACQVNVVVVNAAGAQVWNASSLRQACPALALSLQPGQSKAFAVELTGANLTAGAYTAQGVQGATEYGSYWFSVC